MVRKGSGLAIFFIIIVFVVIIGGVVFFVLIHKSIPLLGDNLTVPNEEKPEEIKPITISVASWDLDVFGRTKANSEDLMGYYVGKISVYDVVVIQGIVDSTSEAWDKLCGRLGGYNCWISSRSGRNISKEQYGVVYRKGLEVRYFMDYNPDMPKDRWEHPPISFDIRLAKTDLEVLVIKASQPNIGYEVDMMQYAPKDFNGGNILVIGNLGIKCGSQASYGICNLDSMIMNQGANAMLRDSGVMNDVNEQQSSYDLVWAKFEG